MAYPSRSNRILQPAKSGFIYLSLIAALLLNYVQLAGLRPFVPDWVAVVLVFWGIRQPFHVGMGIAFVFGVLVDVQNSEVLGLHALAYVVLAFLSNGFSRQVVRHQMLMQAVRVLLMLLVAQVLMGAIMWVGKGVTPRWDHFSPCIAGVVFWLLLTWLLLPQLQSNSRDEN